MPRSLRATVAALAAGEVTAAALVEEALGAIEAGAAPGAFVALDVTRARAEAAAPRPGPLGGVPVAVKDIIDVAGLPTRGGSAATLDTPATADAAIVTRLRAAGAIVIGKTATHELAYGGTTPTVTNPRRPGLTAGGSSGGSAAAVASGIVTVALGTDTAGSVRIPAACCGVSGVVPPPGTLPAEGVLALAESFDTIGPLVAEPGDLALAWAALAGEPGSGEPLRGVRIASPDSLGRVDPGALAAVDDTAARIGLPSAIAEPPPFAAFGPPRGVVIGDEALAAHRSAGLYPDRRDRLGAEIAAFDDEAAARDPAEVTEARRTLRELGAGLRAAIAPGEVLLTPALPSAPPARDCPDGEVVGRMVRLLAPVNAAGLAAAVVPAPGDGTFGVQLVAADVATVLAAVARLSSA